MLLCCRRRSRDWMGWRVLVGRIQTSSGGWISGGTRPVPLSRGGTIVTKQLERSTSDCMIIDSPVSMLINWDTTPDSMTPNVPGMIKSDQLLILMHRCNTKHHAKLHQQSSNYILITTSYLACPHRAPITSSGPTCFGILNPNRLATQSAR